MDLSGLEKEILKKKRRTKSLDEFAQMRSVFQNRLTIVSEGDSWFAYPKKYFIIGKKSNLISYISKATQEKANFLSLESNGDEAVDMISGKQKHKLIDILRWHTRKKNRLPVDLLLFSGGGNDIVGENDFERFLNPKDETYNSAKEYIKMKRLKRKAKQIALAYQELLDIRDEYSPNTLIITHTYDYPIPSLTGGVFLGGLIKTKGWMKRFMDERKIKEEFQADIIKIFMDAIANELLSIRRDKFIVVDSRETLEGSSEWLNEIHPTSKGFKKISKLILKEMYRAFPNLR